MAGRARALQWLAALLPWVVCAGLCAAAMKVPPGPSPRPVMREPLPPPRSPDPPRPKGVRYEPWERVPS